MATQLNFAQQMDAVLKTLDGTRPRLLLHACCGPCSSAVLEQLCQYFEITVLYYNPNTWPAAEYYRRGEELTGLLEALRQLKEPCDIDLYSDSQYVINGLEKGWAKGWRKRGWKKADKSPALNPDLWAPLLEESEKHVIHYHWLKGHAGHPENERCDRLAVEQSKKYGGKQA